MTTVSRPALAPLAGVLLLGCWIVSACSGSSETTTSGTAGTSGGVPAFVAVQNTSLDVTVENRAGGPLLNVRVAIKPVGGLLEFTKMLSRMEAGEKRDLALSQFSGRDGTTFSLRVVRPKEIAVTAVDLVGRTYEMTTPWRN